MSHAAPLTIGEFVVTAVVSDPPWQQNCFIVRHVPSDEQVVIDPGATAEAVVERIRHGGGPASAILLTHGHPDHITGVAGIQRQLGTPCHAHTNERQSIDQAPMLAATMMGMKLEAIEDCQYFDAAPDIALGDQAITVIETPGHTAGGVCYALNGIVFTGDTLFNQGVGRTDLPGGDTATLYNSITTLLEGLDEQAILFSGHGPQWTAAEAKRWWRMMV